MKKFFLGTFILLLICSFIQSCLDDNDDYQNLYYVVLPIDSVSMPEASRLDSIVKITVHTTIVDSCQRFYTFDYTKMGNERTVSTIAMQFSDTTNCGSFKAIAPELKFKPEAVGKYKFRFWKGKDSITKEDLFIEKEIQITLLDKE